MALSDFRRVFIAIVVAGASLASLASIATVAPVAPLDTCLILPFENRSGDASLDWIGESFVTALTESLRGGSVSVLSRQERDQALALAGAPAGVVLSHATMIRIADAADLHWLIIGWYDYDGNQFRAAAALFNLRLEHLVPIAAQSGQLTELEALQGHLAWSLRQQLDPGGEAPPAVAPLPLPAYESYVRALIATSPAAKLKDLNVAIHLAPRDARVVFGLGEAYLAANDNAEALRWLAQVPATSPDFSQAEFSAGLAAYRLERYDRAVAYFGALESQFPLPAVVNDLALARARLATPGSAAVASGPLQTEFPADSFRQLAGVVTQFDAAKMESLPPSQQVKFELDEGRRLQAQGGLEAAAKDFEAVINRLGSGPSPQVADAHAGLAAIWLQRHDPAKATTEAAAALAADPSNAQAKAIEKQLAKPGVVHHG